MSTDMGGEELLCGSCDADDGYDERDDVTQKVTHGDSYKVTRHKVTHDLRLTAMTRGGRRQLQGYTRRGRRSEGERLTKNRSDNNAQSTGWERQHPRRSDGGSFV